MKGVRRQWDELDDYVLLRLHANGRGVNWIAAFMCCASCTVQRNAKRLGLAFGDRHHWTAQEDALLRKRYPDEQAAVIAKELGHRIRQGRDRRTEAAAGQRRGIATGTGSAIATARSGRETAAARDRRQEARMSPRHCQRCDGFSWSRSLNPRGQLVYRLFCRSAAGKLYMVCGTFEANTSRAIMARDLRRLLNNLRVMRKALGIAA